MNLVCVCVGHGWRAWKISLNAHLWVLQTSCNLPTVRAHGYEPVGRGIFVLADGRIKLNQAMKLILFMCCFASCANNFIVFCFNFAIVQRGMVFTEFWFGGFGIEHWLH